MNYDYEVYRYRVEAVHGEDDIERCFFDDTIEEAVEDAKWMLKEYPNCKVRIIEESVILGWNEED